MLVAFAITALVLGAILRIYGEGLRGSERAESRMQATMIAQSKLDELAAAIPLTPQQQSGAVPPRFHWRAEVAPYGELNATELAASPIRLFRITVAVGWGDDGSARRLVTLSTLRADRVAASSGLETRDEEGRDAQ